MSVVFESNIKVNENGNWYIELIDTVSEITHICNTTLEYEEKYQELAEPYGGRIDEVKWTKAENLRPDHFDEIRLWMSQLQQKANETEQQAAQNAGNQGMPQ